MTTRSRGGAPLTDVVDLRSDTVTQPTAAMREAMAAAEVGDDVFGDDPTVNALEDKVAALLGTEAAVFTPTGTQANLCAVMSHCERGDEYLVGSRAHVYMWEGGGAAVLGSVQPQPIELALDGTMDLDRVAAAIKPAQNWHHFANTRLLCIENTHDGHALPDDYLEDVRTLAAERGLALHLDGARLWNAAIVTGRSPAELARGFDSVSVCLSKGLGAPAGSVLAATSEVIERARKWRKMLGGGMRQAGVLAAAGIYALDHHRDRLADDHRRAMRLADALGAMSRVQVDRAATNLIFTSLSVDDPLGLTQTLADAGVRVLAGPTMRLATHLDLDDKGLERAIAALGAELG